MASTVAFTAANNEPCISASAAGHTCGTEVPFPSVTAPRLQLGTEGRVQGEGRLRSCDHTEFIFFARLLMVHLCCPHLELNKKKKDPRDILLFTSLGWAMPVLAMGCAGPGTARLARPARVSSRIPTGEEGTEEEPREGSSLGPPRPSRLHPSACPGCAPRFL